MAFEQTIKNLDNCLTTDKGCTSELDYVEQTLWTTFLSFTLRKEVKNLQWISFQPSYQ